MERMGVEKKNIKPFLIVLAVFIVASIFLINTSFLSTVGPLMFTIVLGFFVLALSVMAGYAVFRSLLVASVGLSLIIFIGDEYCHLPVGQQVANNSLMTLIGIGFAYVTVQFLYSLFKELFGDKEAMSEWKVKGVIAVFKEMSGNKHSWLVLVIYGLLIALFVSHIYNVINPIIHGLCVYK
jgi:hypothetical protein